MLKIVVVEDEPPILRDLVATIEAARNTWKVIGQARDGEEALVTLRKSERPDLVISDIRMPVMDGLELTARIRQEFGALPVMILSGFREFDYARKALSLGVEDYLLKPFSTEGLAIAIERIERSIQRTRRNSMQRSLENALYGSSSGIEGDGKTPIGMATLIAGTVTDPACQVFLAGSIVWDSLPLEGLVAAVLGHTDFWILEGWTSAEQIIIWDPATVSGTLDIETVLSSLFESIPRQITPVIVIAEKKPVFLSELRACYLLQRKYAADQCSPLSSEFLVHDATRLSRDTASTLKPNPLENLVSRALSDGNEEILTGGLSTIVGEWKTRGISQSRAKQEVAFFMNRIGSGLEYSEIEEIFAPAKDLPELVASWKNALTAIMTGNPDAAMETGSGSRDLILAAQRYLEENYTTHISGEELSKKIGIGASYLSKLFKEKIGVSPPEYLVNLRMEQAQRLLSSEAPLMIMEVAEAVGYTDAGHFSRLFKKKFGMWPSEYRKN